MSHTVFTVTYVLRNIQLFSRVEGAPVDLSVKLCPYVLQHPIIPEGTPLCVDAHPALIPLHQVNVPQLLHVACIGARTWAHTHIYTHT